VLLKELELSAAVEALSFSPDGRILAAASSDDGAVRFYDVGPWEERTVLPPAVGDTVLSTGFSADGHYFAVAGTDGLALWRVVQSSGEQATRTAISFQPVRRLTEDRSAAICFSPDGHWLAWLIGPWEADSLTVAVWDLHKMEPHDLSMAKSCHMIRAPGFSADSQHLTFVNDKLQVAVWDVARKKEATSFGELKERLVARPKTHLSADGAWYAVADQTITIWDMAARKLLVTLSPERSAVCTVGRSAVCSVGWSPNRKLLAVGGTDGGLEIWDLPRINVKLAEVGLDW
jgi:WD40 repeat protein